MKKQLCPKCKSSLFQRWAREGSPFAEWMCPVCGYSAHELESRMYVCWLCSGKTLVHLKDEVKDYWWCVDCLKPGIAPELAVRLEALPLPGKMEYAANCLNNYCFAINVKDKSLNQLISHLMSMRIYKKDYFKWEQACESLELKGRGAPLPSSLRRKIPAEKLCAFIKLYENCLEVGRTGIADNAGIWPVHHLKICIGILQDEKVELPKFHHI